MFVNFIFRNKLVFSFLALTFLLNLFLPSQIQETRNNKLLRSNYRIPLFALDSEGKPFYNLEKEDLELYINGKRVETLQIKKFLSTKKSASTETAAAESVQESISKNPERIIIIIFDAMFSSNYGVKRSREIASKLVENASPEDSFLLLVNSARDGLNHLLGPEKKKDIVIKKIKKAKIFPGAKWFEDSFARRDSFMERFSASSDYKVNEYADPAESAKNKVATLKKQYTAQVKKFSLKIPQVEYAFQMITKPKILYLFSEGFQDDDLTEKYYDPSIAEAPDASTASSKFELENFNFSNIISGYFRRFMKAIKEGGNIIFTINPGELKTMSYDSAGAMELEYLTGRDKNFFQALSTEKLIESLLNTSAAYFELIWSREEAFGDEQKIEVKCNLNDVYVQTPSSIIEKNYHEMKADQKRRFAINVVTDGILSQMIGKAKKSKYRKSINKFNGRLYKCTIEVKPPDEMQNHLTDIFSIALNKNTKKWRVQLINKIISKKEKLTFVLNDKQNYDLYFALINASTADSIYNKIE